MITIAYKIELVPNNKQKTYFRKAFGCARLAYNWGLAEWQRRYKEGEIYSSMEIQKVFDSIKREQILCFIPNRRKKKLQLVKDDLKNELSV